MKTETKIKLSPKQKEVIKAARIGVPCSVFGCKTVILPYSEYAYLIDAKILQPNNNPFIYGLTELGKTIDIN